MAEKESLYSQHKPKKVYIIITSKYDFLFYLIYFFFSVFSQTHVWIFTQPTSMRNYKYRRKFCLQQEKHITVNRFSIGEVEL